MDFNFKRDVSFYIHVCIIILALPTFIAGVQIRSSNYYVVPGRKIQSEHVLDTRTVLSKVECVMRCEITDGCASVSFKSTTNECIMSYLNQTEVALNTESVSDWESYSVKDWLLAFRGPKGIGGDVYESFVDGVNVTTGHVDCIDLTSTACQNNYRHPILDSWTTAGITKVRFSFYKNQAEAAYVVFNATGSSLTSWFTKERILDSTWVTSATDSYVIFAMDGGVNIKGIILDTRRFSMFLGFGGCPNDIMYSVAIVGYAFYCSFDYQTTYPQYIYASSQSRGYPESGVGTDMADFMAIFVQ